MGSRFVIGVAAIAALFLSGCGSPSSTPQAAASPSSAASPTVEVATISVAGAQEMVLTTPSGVTLYYLTSDVGSAPRCTGACLTNWPPLMSTGTPTLMAGISGTLTVVTNANGSQVAYNGHLLYLFAGDKAKGDTNGEGIKAFGGVWHVAAPALAAG